MPDIRMECLESGLAPGVVYVRVTAGSAPSVLVRWMGPGSYLAIDHATSEPTLYQTQREAVIGALGFDLPNWRA